MRMEIPWNARKIEMRLHNTLVGSISSSTSQWTRLVEINDEITLIPR